MTRLLQHPWGWTTIAPLACAVHCLTAPVLAAVTPAIASNPAVEWSLLGATVVIAAVALTAGIRTHRVFWPSVGVGVGIAFWTASLLHAFRPIPEDFTTTAAALLTATGLLWNSRLLCGARSRPCPGCELEHRELGHPDGSEARPLGETAPSSASG